MCNVELARRWMCLLLALTFAACSGSNPFTSSPSCDRVVACCRALPVAQQSSCLASAEQQRALANSEAACAEQVRVWEASGICSGTPFDAEVLDAATNTPDDALVGQRDAPPESAPMCTTPTPTPLNIDGRSAPAFSRCGQCTSPTSGQFIPCDAMRASSCSYAGNNAVGMPRCYCGQNSECGADARCVESGSTFICVSVTDAGPASGTRCGSRFCVSPSAQALPASVQLGESCCDVNGIPTCVPNTEANCGCGIVCSNGQTCVAGFDPGVGTTSEVCCGQPLAVGGGVSLPIGLCSPSFPVDGGF